MNLYQLCREAGIVYPTGGPDPAINGIKTDSRLVEQGDLFVCIRGFHADGHDYIEDALDRGAVAVVVEEAFCGKAPAAACLIAVEDSRHAAAMLYDAWYDHPSRKLKIIAVTGTNGKTSVTHMLLAIFEAAMHKCGLIGTVHCRSAGRSLDIRGNDPLANMTTPDPEQLYQMLDVMVRDGVEYVFMEVTSHALALRKPDALTFEAAIFTNLTPEHLDLHGDMENYFLTKSKLFSMCKTAILNVDDPYGRRLADEVPCRALTCSMRGAADFMAEDIHELGVDGNEYFLSSPRICFTVRTPLPGRFNISNTLEAAACAAWLGIAPSVIKEAMAGLVGIAGRMERVRLGKVTDFSVFVDYAHTPDALTNLLTTARSIRQAGQRVVLVFGCGGDRDVSKREVMGRIAAELADACIVTSDNSRSEEPEDIIRDILRGMEGADVRVIPDRAEAIRYAVCHARPGDIILLAGKGHEQYEINKTGKHPFHEREIAMRALEKD